MLQKSLLDWSLKGLDSKLQAQLSLYYNHQMMIEQFRHSKEMEQMKQEIIDEVLSRISVSADVTNAVQQIEKLKETINKLGN